MGRGGDASTDSIPYELKKIPCVTTHKLMDDIQNAYPSSHSNSLDGITFFHLTHYCSQVSGDLAKFLEDGFEVWTVFLSGSRQDRGELSDLFDAFRP